MNDDNLTRTAIALDCIAIMVALFAFVNETHYLFILTAVIFAASFILLLSTNDNPVD